MKKIFVLLAKRVLFLLGLAIWAPAAADDGADQTAFNWQSNWAVTEGFTIEIDTEGYQFPTAITFVPNPGPDPKDPLYFVTELRGQVKVVTNDRTVYTFAEDFFELEPEQELPEVEGETGLAGICLEPERGFVFVTFAYQDSEGILRNNIMRFQSQPEVFSLEPTAAADFSHIFASSEAAVSHQIGSCQVADGLLYVSLGDGRQTEQSREIDSVLGKVLRLTTEGQPAQGNPFYEDNGMSRAADYVWAYGFRNPFGLEVVGERVFVADNGSDIDRFLEVRAGEDYLWSGTDWSIGARADVALAPDVGPAQVDYYPAGLTLFPEQYGQSFFVATSKPEEAGVLRIRYDLEQASAQGVPEFLLRYQGTATQIVSGVALGPDGLYFVPTLPDIEGRSAVFKVSYAPQEPYPFLLSDITDPLLLMREKGCFGCHQLNNDGGTAGPALDQPLLADRLEARLGSDAYVQRVAEVNGVDREPFRNYREARAEVLQAEGQEQLRTWMIYHIMEPRFDNPSSQMPNLGLSKTEAAIITDYLLEEDSFLERGQAFLGRLVPQPIKPRYVYFAFAGGLVAGAALLAAAFGILNGMRRGSKD